MSTKLDRFEEDFLDLFQKVNVPCATNCVSFTNQPRVNVIKQLLTDSDYDLLSEQKLSLIYQHKKYEKEKPAFLISAHIDALYNNYHWDSLNEEEILGTFDNSLCNALLLYKMINNELPYNVLVAFTGGEEYEDNEGANQAVRYLRNGYNIDLVVVLDVTGEGYDESPFTIENFFLNTLKQGNSSIFGGYLIEKVSKKFAGVKLVDNADPDESWKYNELGLNCFSFCFPTRPHPINANREISEWMHDDWGIIIKRKNLKLYSDGLSLLLEELNKDLPRFLRFEHLEHTTNDTIHQQH